VANQHVADCRIQPDGLLSIELHSSDCQEVIERLKARIRLLSHQEHRADHTNTAIFTEVATLSRMGFGLAKNEKLVNLSLGDTVVLFNAINPHMDRHKVSFLITALVAAQKELPIRQAMNEDPVWNDGLAKDMQSIMEG